MIISSSRKPALSMRYVIGCVLLLAASTLSGCKEEAAEAPPPRNVRAAVVEYAPFGETITQFGEIRPETETPLGFRMGGTVVFRAETGQKVAQGDVIARLDPIPARNEVSSAGAAVSEAEAALVLARQTERRTTTLAGRGVSSTAMLEDATTNRQLAEARLEAAKASLANAEDALSRTEIRAQHDGIVTATGANAGQIVAAGQMVITTISANERDAVFDLPEALVRPELADLDVTVALISNPQTVATGKVREVTPSADVTTRTYRVRVALTEGGDRMPFGAAISGRITLAPRDLAILPASALTEHNGVPAVFVIDPESNTLSYRNVDLLRFDATHMYIASGLRAGEIVAVSGVSKLREGLEVVADTTMAEVQR